MQLLKQSVNYNNYNYCKRKSIKLPFQFHKAELRLMENRPRHLWIYFIRNKMTSDYRAIKVTKIPPQNRYKAAFLFYRSAIDSLVTLSTTPRF